jgi:hypothetical protein
LATEKIRLLVSSLISLLPEKAFDAVDTDTFASFAIFERVIMAILSLHDIYKLQHASSSYTRRMMKFKIEKFSVEKELTFLLKIAIM